MDGMLSFFEQESFAFGRFLPGFLLPGPLRYIAKTDSFITVSSSRLVESYKYVALSQNFILLRVIVQFWVQNTAE